MEKLLVSDYDNTFHVDDIDIYKNIEAVSKFRKAGNKFIIATGRAYFDMKKKIKTFSIKYDYLILGHGTIIIDNNEKIIYSCIVNEKIVEEIYNKIKKCKDCTSSAIYGKKRRYINKPHYKNITKILVKFNTAQNADNFSDMINKKYEQNVKAYRIFSSKKNLVEVISNKTSKSNAIAKILEKKEFIRDNIYVIGDDSNDIEMIKDFDGYCMKNSIEKLKKICNKQVDSVRELIEKIV